MNTQNSKEFPLADLPDEDSPEWTDEMFDEADFYKGSRLVRKGKERSQEGDKQGDRQTCWHDDIKVPELV